MKTYLKDLTPEEIITRLKNGEFLQNPFGGYYKMVDGIICKFLPNGNTVIAECLSSQMNGDCYFETEEPFEIKEAGLYKTRDNRKVYICFIKNNMAYGCIDGYVRETFDTWLLNGRSLKTIDEESPADIVKKKYFDFKGKDND